MSPSAGDTRELERISKQLEDIRRLMVLQLLAAGVQSTHVAKALGIDASGISRMLPVREIQSAAKRGKGSDG